MEKNKIRIFGKRYTTDLRSSDYIQGRKSNKMPSAKIFQSYIKLKRYRELSKKEKSALFSYLLKSRTIPKAGKAGLRWTNLYGKWGENDVKGNDVAALKKQLEVFLQEKNPYYISSSVLTDLLLPTTDVDVCSGYC